MADLPFPELKKGAQGQPAPPEKKPEPKKGGGLFTSKPKAPPVDIGQQISSLNNMINDLGRRLRILEEKFNNMDKKIKLNEENAIANIKRINTSIASFQDDVNDFRKHIKIDDERTELIIKELKLSAKKEDLAVLQRYIELWDPVKFATHTEIEKIIKEKIAEIMQK
ncbi:hypothetical protein KY345_03050 [Candidatus Woesearchaeota archaeon]|nr:hypothetical protein [Candidatus Woesearchaeota archaeon]